MGGVYADKVVSAHSTGTAAVSTTVATVREVDGKPIALFRELRVRLNLTAEMGGDTPTCDVYLQRAVAEDPDSAVDADWEDFFHFPQMTTSKVDRIINLPLPLPQDVDASLGSYSRARAIEALAADTVLGGHWMGPIRVREVVTKGAGAITAGIYDIEMVGR